MKVSQGKLKARTADEYGRLLRSYVLDSLGARAVAAVSPAHVEQLLAALVRQQSRQGDCKPFTPGTVKHVWDVTAAGAAGTPCSTRLIAANPCDAVDFSASKATGDHTGFVHRPSDRRGGWPAERCNRRNTALWVRRPALPAYPAYALMVEFMAYTGLRAAEVAGLEVGDLMFAPGPKLLGEGRSDQGT